MSLAPAPTPQDDEEAQPAAAVAAPSRGRARAFLAEYRYPLTIFAASRLLTFLAIGMVGWVRRPHGSTDLGGVFLTPLRQWDGTWYLQIAQHGYDPTFGHGNAAAFFPLYPATIAAVRLVVPLSNALLGVVISTLAFGVAVCAVYRLTADRFGAEVARRTITYMGIAPLAFVFSSVYTESLCLALVAGSFLLLERRRVTAACTLAAFAVLARPIGLLLAPAIAWRVFDEHGRRFSLRLVVRLVPVLLIPAAFLGFQLYLKWRTGEFNATSAAEERGWGRTTEVAYVLLLPLGMVQAVWVALTSHDLGYAFSAFCAGAATWLLAWGAWRRRIPLEYVIFGLGSLVLPAATGTFLGMPRFALLLVPCFWALALLGRDPRVDNLIRSLFPALLVGMAFVSFGWGTFTP
jgi:hypothetical protein